MDGSYLTFIKVFKNLLHKSETTQRNWSKNRETKKDLAPKIHPKNRRSRHVRINRDETSSGSSRLLACERKHVSGLELSRFS